MIGIAGVLTSAAVEVALTITGEVIVWAVSFDRWRGERLSSDESCLFGRAGARSLQRDGRRVTDLYQGTFYLMPGVIFL